jgi:hypothetical protein
MKALNEFLNEGVKYDKITVRSSKFNKYVVITPKGDVQWTKDDGKAHEFDSVEDGLEFIKTKLPEHKDPKKYDVEAFYKDKGGYLESHYHFVK